MPDQECGWCSKPGHHEAEHPLSKDHPDYDAFYDATDDELYEQIRPALDRIPRGDDR